LNFLLKVLVISEGIQILPISVSAGKNAFTVIAETIKLGLLKRRSIFWGLLIYKWD